MPIQQVVAPPADQQKYNAGGRVLGGGQALGGMAESQTDALARTVGLTDQAAKQILELWGQITNVEDKNILLDILQTGDVSPGGAS